MSDRFSEIRKVVEAWGKGLPSGMLTIEEQATDFERKLEVLPSNPQSCSVRIHISRPGGMIVGIGDYLQYEDDDEDFPDDGTFIPELLDCVYNGRVHGKIWMKGQRVLRQDMEAELASKTYRRVRYLTWIPLFLIACVSEKTIQYEPYFGK
jgi:hypothetical protein